MNISAEMVRQLREETGAGMMDCKSALVEAKGDVESARQILRKKGLAAAAKKAGRAASEGVVAAYIHAPDDRVGALVEVNCETDFVARTPEFKTLARNIAMHVAAASPAVPLYVGKEEVPAEALAKEKEIYKAQAAAQGKPPAVVDKIAEGKLKEYYSTFCLLEQPYIKGDKQSVSQYLAAAGKEKGCKYVVTRFVRYKLGEGIEKKSDDFAGEVAAALR